ncbi:MAG: phosphatidylglycerol lysyltransferase domain-containing protein [Desulfobacterales bacterium]
MQLEFEPIHLEQQANFLKALAQCSQKSSDYSFSNLFGWADEYGLTWAWDENLVWIRQSKPQTRLWAPIGPWEAIDWDDVFKRRFESGTRFMRIPETLSRLWRKNLGDRIVIEEDRDHWDYLYDINEMVELKGNRFHKKKNLLKQFIKKYDYRFETFSPAMIEPAMAMQADWCNWRDCESSDVLSAENRSVFKVLMHWNELVGLTGGVIIVEDIIVAYTLAEKMSDESVVVHYEKGCPDYKGVYQAINQMFLESLPENFKIVNREQDLGEQGLRQAKMSYNPSGFLKKYRVEIKWM